MRLEIHGKYFGEKTFPSLNNYLHECNRTPLAGGAMKKKFQTICERQLKLQIGDYKLQTPICITYEFYEPKKGVKRDLGNVFAFTDKVFEDALVKVGFLPDDNPNFVRGLAMSLHYTDKVPYIVIDIQEGVSVE